MLAAPLVRTLPIFIYSFQDGLSVYLAYFIREIENLRTRNFAQCGSRNHRFLSEEAVTLAGKWLLLASSPYSSFFTSYL